ncbi:hypothetical protein GOP47_0030710 [Adiantum capillus-veneris]|nr:hypothetical protein GOP47_0030710 [Adiantum capillus-veneris]
MLGTSSFATANGSPAMLIELDPSKSCRRSSVPFNSIGSALLLLSPPVSWSDALMGDEAGTSRRPGPRVPRRGASARLLAALRKAGEMRAWELVL